MERVMLKEHIHQEVLDLVGEDAVLDLASLTMVRAQEQLFALIMKTDKEANKKEWIQIIENSSECRNVIKTMMHAYALYMPMERLMMDVLFSMRDELECLKFIVDRKRFDA